MEDDFDSQSHGVEAEQEKEEWESLGEPDADGKSKKPDGGNDAVKKTAKGMIVVGVLGVVWEIGKWGVAIAGAPETFGGSLAGAAALP